MYRDHAEAGDAHEGALLVNREATVDVASVRSDGTEGWPLRATPTGTIELLTKSLNTSGIILIGEPYWRQLPPTEDVAKECFAGSISDYLMLPKLLASFGDLGYDVVEMVLADQDGWDRYEAAKWLTMRRWLEANPDDDFAKDVRSRLTSEPERYASYTRKYMGWGVFALMARVAPAF